MLFGRIVRRGEGTSGKEKGVVNQQGWDGVG